MRKFRTAMLAVPVLAAVYIAAFARRRRIPIVAVSAAAFAVVAVVASGSSPAPSVAVPESTPRPVSADLFMPIRTSHAVTDPFTIGFAAPMNTATVAGALSVEPATPFRLGWDATARTLTISPLDHWQPDTLYRVAVGPTARSDAGAPLDGPLQTVLLTSRAGRADLVATRAVDRRVGLDAAFVITADRPVRAASVRLALRTEPSVAGDVLPGEDGVTFTFRPFAPLAPDTAYRVWFSGLVDADGVPFAEEPSLAVRTIAAPRVVRFRPKAGTGRIERGQVLSVRFSTPMDRERTAAAFSVTAAGKAVRGATSWAEKGKVLVFDPTRPLPYDATVTMSVDLSARSAAGAPIAGAARESVRVVRKPEPPPVRDTGGGSASSPSGGGGAASGSWVSVERYYLRLMNCTRTGGWVTSSGACSSPGGRDVAPLALSAGISSKVARPYAKLLATRNQCSHFAGSGPDDRLRRAGYSSYRWAENLGCRSGNPTSAVLGSHLFFQAEKPYNGGHYRNLMNPAFDRVGIGVWVAGGRVRLVVDFYHP